MGISGRGGVRAGGGRPPNWQHRPSCTIRVPKVFAEVLMEIAKTLDKGLEEVLAIDPKSLKVHPQVKKESLSLSQLRIYRHSGHQVLRLQELKRIVDSCCEQKD